jgi:hypothetical protein
MFRVGDTNLFQENGDLTVTTQRRRRVYRCGHCREEGHNRQTCPQLSEQRALENQQRSQQIQQTADTINTNRNRARQRVRRTLARSHNPPSPNGLKSVRINNNSEHVLAIYWTPDLDSPILNTPFRYLAFIDAYSHTFMRFANHHRFISTPLGDLTPRDTMDDSILIINESNPHTIFSDTKVSDIETIDEGTPDEQLIVFIEGNRDYKPRKTILEQWKEMAFKSYYLLTELDRMGASKNDNLATMMDMVQDITIPTHTQHDKEFAGVPSTLTNIT